MDRRDGVGDSAEAVELTYTLGRDDFVGALRAGERRRTRRATTCLRATMSEQGVVISGGSRESRTTWSDYGSYMETEQAFILRGSDGKGRLTPLPKRGLADEGEAARLRVLLDRHLRRV
jgi:hypothetical protein